MTEAAVPEKAGKLGQIDQEIEGINVVIESLGQSIQELTSRLSPIRVLVPESPKKPDTLLKDSSASTIRLSLQEIHDSISKQRGEIVGIIESLDI